LWVGSFEAKSQGCFVGELGIGLVGALGQCFDALAVTGLLKFFLFLALMDRI
jgi:hypothetical protein